MHEVQSRLSGYAIDLAAMVAGSLAIGIFIVGISGAAHAESPITLVFQPELAASPGI